MNSYGHWHSFNSPPTYYQVGGDVTKRDASFRTVLCFL
ncbi:hypothetical protein XFF6992_40024 [Xanthomonas citri pv. fuscans]|uniref:Uncharacterized protein n=1 Tax=Xanthomonas campestris pv. phaseoli TaxID=317013 RepID=A0A7Z7J355_XANCH|nr:hypothetical protein XFF6990_10058 [Xanthomonas citri pv. fuscans]SOO20087.1 hypothetical protein XFF6992_40024 [Xanthomonas citri pv. fuscans]SOO26470.1 hypothetical protein XFF6991_570035 [Xanthomonas phaseoli pv. phaseoli]SOO31934.1 hypothetical protein XFF6994_160024 [Xanthomonas citri pv. fuscans]